jgi:hypothetical protein
MFFFTPPASLLPLHPLRLLPLPPAFFSLLLTNEFLIFDF